MMMLPLANAMPNEKNARAPETAAVDYGVEDAVLVDEPHEGFGRTMNQGAKGSVMKKIWRAPMASVWRKPVKSSTAAKCDIA